MPSRQMESSSSELLNRAKNGSVSSLERLLIRHDSYLRGLSMTRFDPRLRRRIASGDLVQDTLLEAYRDFAQFRGTTTCEFTGWLRQILIHNAGREVEKHLKAAKRDLRREQPLRAPSRFRDESENQLSSILIDSNRSPASEAEHQDQLMLMAGAIERLPRDYREVILLRHTDGLEFDAIAKRLGRSAGAARMLWMRAIGRLREEMEVSTHG